MVVENSKNMFKFNFILLLYVGLMYVEEINSIEKFFENFVDRANAELVIGEIQPNEALPFVLFTRGNKLHLPKNLKSVTLNDGKMIQEVEFSYDAKYEQIFFCTKENSDEKCLVPKISTGQEPLQCASQPTPVIDSLNQPCGKDKTGNYYTFNYEICETDESESTMIPFYTTCYDKENQKTLYTLHTFNSPLLLEAKLLWRERHIEYSMMKKKEFPALSNRGPNDMEVDELPAPQPGYKWQKLVPSEDMALASWRKTTFQETNYALQHEKLRNLWGTISKYVRSNAIRMFKQNKIKTIIHTGVFDVDLVSKDHNQLSNIWVKLITTTYSYDEKTNPTHGVAILINNFIDTETSQSTSSNSDPEGIDGYCTKSICIDALNRKFEQIKGHVRCCAVTKKILDLFNEGFVELQELHIPNINVTEDQETFKDGLNITNEEAEKALRAIQPNEILPIVLSSEPNDSKRHLPVAIRRLETKNRRIVNGSQFIDVKSGQQIFFCPQEKSDQKCLAPREFDRFETLQCTKEPIPAISLQGRGEIKCGIDDSGILHKVVYEFCPKQPPHENENTKLRIYHFCYDPNKKTVLYTRHRVSSAYLLNSKLLIREREVEYPMLEDVELSLSNIEELKEAASKENEIPTSSIESKKTPYKLQKFVSPEDMAFAAWKRATFQYVNVALQHEDLIVLWKNIDHYIRQSTFRADGIENVINYYHFEDFIYTGVLNLPSKSSGVENGDDQKSEIWFKMVHTRRPTKHQDGIVILMNNYLIPKKENSEGSDTEKNTLEDFCQENLCLKEFQNEFEQIGGRVRCCFLTKNISKSLGIPNVHHDAGILVIPGIIAELGESSKNLHSTITIP